jgi:hypothetical protein
MAFAKGKVFSNAWVKPLSSAESLLCFCEERRVQQVTRLDVILLGAIFGVHHSVETIEAIC